MIDPLGFGSLECLMYAHQPPTTSVVGKRPPVGSAPSSNGRPFRMQEWMLGASSVDASPWRGIDCRLIPVRASLSEGQSHVGSSWWLGSEKSLWNRSKAAGEVNDSMEVGGKSGQDDFAVFELSTVTFSFSTKFITQCSAEVFSTSETLPYWTG